MDLQITWEYKKVIIMSNGRPTRVVTILGTRPELIRLSCLIDSLDKNFEHRLIHTGQNSDSKLSEIFFNEMEIRAPDKYLKIDSTTLGNFLGVLFNEIEKEFQEFSPDAVVILGDTNSALSGILAKRMGIPVYHLEAGNRSFDPNVPEEINRRIVDHTADFNLAYSQYARDNLLKEGLHPRNSIVIGSPLNEVFAKYKDKINSSKILEELGVTPGGYFLVSAHRQENIDNENRLSLLLDTMNGVAENYGLPVIVSTHPRMKDKLENVNSKPHMLLNFHPPFGFFDYSKLQLNSRMVLSDSGSISEESAIFKFKAITIRDSMERPEALESASILLAGITKSNVLEAMRIVENDKSTAAPPFEYQIPDTSRRVVNFISSTLHQHKFWSGLREK